MGQPVHGGRRPTDRLGITVRRHACGRALFGGQLHLRHCGRSYRGKGWPATDTFQTLGTRFRRGALRHLPKPYPDRRAGLCGLRLHFENLDVLFRGRRAATGVVIVSICLGLAVNFHRAYRNTGRRSAILKTEARAALIDGALSVGSGAALLSLPYLEGTILGPYVPIGDAVIVLLLILAIIWQPLSTFRTTLADLAGVSAPSSTYAKVARAARNLAREKGYRLHRAAVLQAGRMHWVAVYLDPKKPVLAEEIDQFRDLLSNRLEDAIGPARVEVVLTASDSTKADRK